MYLLNWQFFSSSHLAFAPISMATSSVTLFFSPVFMAYFNLLSASARSESESLSFSSWSSLRCNLFILFCNLFFGNFYLCRSFCLKFFPLKLFFIFFLDMPHNLNELNNQFSIYVELLVSNEAYLS